MAAIEQVRKDTDNPSAGAFKFLRYERSSEVRRVSDSSVSYASAIAVI
jgi:predicted class III extradiol MEMO1 family dioxygenase